MHRSASEAPPRDVAHPAGVPPVTLDGWYVLHQLFTLDWPALKALDRSAASELLGRFGAAFEDELPDDGGWSGVYRVVGGGADFLLLHFRPSLEGLMEAARRVHLAELADHLVLDHEYLSIVELGLYGLTTELAGRVDPADRQAWEAAVAEALAEEREKGFVQRRLYPRQPSDKPYICYYPMDKRRNPGQNWYGLPLAERAALMRAHGSVGRMYAGRISQVISGSMGLADWEWAVTLFAGDPREFKNIITEMRYDEASAEYGEFGPFYVGVRVTPDDLAALLADGA